MGKQVRGSDVTVVTPTIIGRDDMLARARRSVLEQKVPAGAHIVQYDRNRRGAAAARNAALADVKTDWVAWLDDDDTLLPNHIGVLTRTASRTGADMVFSYAEFRNADGTLHRDPLACCFNGKLVPAPLHVPFGPAQRNHLDSRGSSTCMECGHDSGNFIPVTYMARTELVRAAGGFPEPYSMPEVLHSGDCEDYLLLLRMLDLGADFHHVPAQTWVYYFHGANTGGRGADRMHELEET